MVDELITIKKLYGEKMMHLCRDSFSTILETPGLLLGLLKKKFDPSHELYYDLEKNGLIDNFKKFIYFSLGKETSRIVTDKSVYQLMDEAGYNLYKCDTEQDIKAFRKYYETDEELCSFRGDRLKTCYVFFAVKKNVKEIKRKDFKNPERQDLYGTSVISIQFTNGLSNTLSIKNRYNHHVDNPDATFSNNLENIIPGLTEAFEREFGYKVLQNDESNFEIPGYVRDNRGKYHKYYIEVYNKYYCKGNVILDNFSVIDTYKEPERYLFADYYIIDLKEKTVFTYDHYLGKDAFLTSFYGIENISVKNVEDGKEVRFKIKDKDDVYLKIDDDHNIVEYCNPNVENIWSNFMYNNKKLRRISLPNVKSVSSGFLYSNTSLEYIDMPNLESAGNFFLRCNNSLSSISLPKLKSVGNGFLERNKILSFLDLPSLENTESEFLLSNEELEELILPSCVNLGFDSLKTNNKIVFVYMPLLEIIPSNFLNSNTVLEELNLESVIYINKGLLDKNTVLKSVYFPNLSSIDSISNNIKPHVYCVLVDYINNRYSRKLNIQQL